MSFEYDVFVSHSSKDKNDVYILRDILGKEFRVWFAYEGIEGSDLWVKKIEEGITNSAILLVYWTKNASESQWVEREILKAQEQRKQIIPMVFDDTSLTISLIDTQAINFPESYSEALGKLGRKIKDYIGNPSQILDKALPWRYESQPTSWNNFFQRNGYLDPESKNFAINANTRQLYDYGQDGPLNRFATFVAAPIPHELAPLFLPDVFSSADVVFKSDMGMGPSIGKPDPSNPWRWFNLTNLRAISGHQEFTFIDSADLKPNQGQLPSHRFLRFMEVGAIEYASNRLTFLPFKDPPQAGFRLVTLLGETAKFLGLANIVYKHWGYRGDFQLLVNLRDTENTILADFAPGWEYQDYIDYRFHPFAKLGVSGKMNMQFVYRISAGVLSDNPDISMDLVNNLGLRVQSSFGLGADKRHLDKTNNQFPWDKYYHGEH